MMNNPWADRWEFEIGSQHADYRSAEGRMEQAMMKREADDARERGTRTCDKCGGTAWHRPGVGGWWCEQRHLVR